MRRMGGAVYRSVYGETDMLTDCTDLHLRDLDPVECAGVLDKKTLREDSEAYEFVRVALDIVTDEKVFAERTLKGGSLSGGPKVKIVSMPPIWSDHFAQLQTFALMVTL